MVPLFGRLLGGISAISSSVSKLGLLRFLYTVPEVAGRSSLSPMGDGGEESCDLAVGSSFPATPEEVVGWATEEEEEEDDEDVVGDEMVEE